MKLANTENSIKEKRISFVETLSTPLSPMISSTKRASEFTTLRKPTSLKLDPSPKHSFRITLEGRRSTDLNTCRLPSINRKSTHDLKPFRHGSSSRVEIFNPKKAVSSTNVGTSLIGFKGLFKDIYKKNEKIGEVIKKIRSEGDGKEDVNIMDYHLDIVIVLLIIAVENERCALEGEFF
jgi:hypothetical protein